MSYVAAALTGERDVFYNGKRMPAAMAIEEAGLTKYVFEPKEPLAIINGTAAMTGIALIVIDRAKRIIDSSIIASALAIHAMKGNVRHFHPTISSAKPHPGQSVVAGTLVELLETQGSHAELQSGELESLQDPYSLRCSPQIVGVLVDALQWINTWIEIEANSNNDNPIFDPDSGEVLMGGNFYG
jgi:histidine ammonia-lyase